MDNKIHWHPIKGYPGYECSELGVRSMNYRNTGIPTILKYSCNRGGYPMVPIYRDKKMSFVTIHRVIMCNIYPCEGMELLEVDHIDKNKLNFNPSNLRWCTKLDNSKYSWLDGKRKLTNNFLVNHPRSTKGKFGSMHHLSKPILYTSENGEQVKYGGLREAARLLSMAPETITNLISGKMKTYKGRSIRFQYI